MDWYTWLEAVLDELDVLTVENHPDYDEETLRAEFEAEDFDPWLHDPDGDKNFTHFALETLELETPRLLGVAYEASRLTFNEGDTPRDAAKLLWETYLK